MTLLQNSSAIPRKGEWYDCNEPEAERPSVPLTPFEIQRRDLRDRIAALANHLPGKLGYPVRSSRAIPYHGGDKEDTGQDVYVVAVVQELGAGDRNGFLQFCSPHKGPASRGDRIECHTIINGSEVDMVVTHQLRVLACIEGNLGESLKTELEDEMVRAGMVLEELETFVQAS